MSEAKRASVLLPSRKAVERSFVWNPPIRALIKVLTPDVFYISLTFMSLVMLVLGGLESLSGTVLGVVVVSLIDEVLSSLEQGVDLPGGLTFNLPLGVQQIMLGAIMVVVLVFRSDGIMRGREIADPLLLAKKFAMPAASLWKKVQGK